MKQIVRGQFDSFQSMYKPFLEEYEAKELLRSSSSNHQENIISQVSFNPQSSQYMRQDTNFKFSLSDVVITHIRTLRWMAYSVIQKAKFSLLFHSLIALIYENRSPFLFFFLVRPHCPFGYIYVMVLLYICNDYIIFSTFSNIVLVIFFCNNIKISKSKKIKRHCLSTLHRTVACQQLILLYLLFLKR